MAVAKDKAAAKALKPAQPTMPKTLRPPHKPFAVNRDVFGTPMIDLLRPKPTPTDTTPPRKKHKHGRIQLPRPPDVSDKDMKVLKDIKKLNDHMRGESVSESSDSSDELDFLTWLKTDDDYEDKPPVETMELKIKLPHDKRKVYDWLKFYYENSDSVLKPSVLKREPEGEQSACSSGHR